MASLRRIPRWRVALRGGNSQNFIISVTPTFHKSAHTALITHTELRGFSFAKAREASRI